MPWYVFSLPLSASGTGTGTGNWDMTKMNGGGFGFLVGLRTMMRGAGGVIWIRVSM